jgi:ASCH domain
VAATTHIVIMREPYLTRVLSGEKTVESRFLRVRAAPFDRVAPGDRLLLKRVGGPIVATATAGVVRQFADLNRERALALLAQFRDQLRLEDDFLPRVQLTRYAVLIWLADVQPLATPRPYAKRDRRGWVVLPGTEDRR